MKSKILIKLTSLAVSFALCLSTLPLKGLFADAKTYVDEVLGNKHYGYDFESIKDMFHDIIYNTAYNKNPDEILANGDKKHKESNNFISKIVFSTGAAVIAAKLAWNLHKIHKGNKTYQKKRTKAKSVIDKKSFWAKIKEKLIVCKDEFLIYTALITLQINLSIRYLNDYFYSLKHEEISKFLSEGKDGYFSYLEQLLRLTCENKALLIDKIWYLTYREANFEGEEIKFLSTICPYTQKKVNHTEEEKVKFVNDLKEIRKEINKIFKENGMQEFNEEDYFEVLKNQQEVLKNQQRA